MVTVAGGTTPYTYAWSNGQTSATATNLSANTYRVTVTDARGCTATSSVAVSQPVASLTSSFASSNITTVDCFGNFTGSATVTVTGGTTPYTYAWTNGQTSATATNLAANTYRVTVTDARGCSAT